MSVASEDLAVIINNKFSNLTLGVNLFISQEPATDPDNCAVVYSGVDAITPQLALDKTVYEYPSVEFRVRNNDYLAGQVIAVSVYNYLHGITNITVNNGTDTNMYYLIEGMTSPYLAGYDDNERAVWEAGFMLYKQPETPAIPPTDGEVVNF